MNVRLQPPVLNRRATLVAIAAAALLAACGGGGGSGVAPTEQALALTQGPIEGFGSVIVGGVRFDDSAARVVDDDGGLRRAGDLRLGASVEIDSGRIDRAGGRAEAREIRFGGELVGPVTSVDAAAGRLVLLGQGVDVRPTTVFDDSLGGGLAAIAVGRVVEVHAQLDAASGRWIATRIEADDGAAAWKLRGSVAALDTAQKTFRLDGALVSYAGVDPATLPARFADGLRVRVRLATQAPAASGAWTATSVRSGERRVEDHAEFELRGTVTRFESASRFAIDGVEVDASAAAFPDGSAGLAAGARVEAEGAMTGGVLVARKVELEDRRADALRFELHGAIESVAAGAASFVLRGTTVAVGSATAFERGGLADLVVGRRVEAKGALGADGRTLAAATIKLED